MLNVVESRADALMASIKAPVANACTLLQQALQAHSAELLKHAKTLDLILK